MWNCKLCIEQINIKSQLDVKLSAYLYENEIAKLVKEEIINLIPSGNANLDSIAANLAVGKRTLQRKLKAEQLCFKSILNEVRVVLITNYIRLELSSDEIAILVGYNDTSSYVRAFKTIMGTTISQYRTLND